ncbi:hypothetical protein BBJ28_00011289 [Nothophytophthora sp. Chile5]|nr:hypothetical protein BBJ28_00011289 [Nothophytophthora sp. Chile5]
MANYLLVRSINVDNTPSGTAMWRAPSAQSLALRWTRARSAAAAPLASAPSFGIAFDIDGVLIRGGHELPRARHILQSLRANNVPHIFLTNGGGCMEEEKAKYLSNILELPINPKHMVLSHTPMREIAKGYGGACEPIEAIIVMHDPINWAPEIQVAVDVLIGGDPPGSGRPSGKQTPLFVSNDDFIFSGAYPFPRFAQGTEYAEDLLNSISGSSEPLKHIYGIGDNPLSDIQGANNAGEKWTSVLVRSGIYDGSKEPEHVPDVTVEGVYEAIQHIYEREGVDKSTL